MKRPRHPVFVIQFEKLNHQRRRGLMHMVHQILKGCQRVLEVTLVFLEQGMNF